MSGQSPEANTRRVARLERCEPRLVLSANPIGQIRADFHLESSLDQQAEQQRPFTTLEEAHRLTGLDSIRSEFNLRGEGQTVAVIDSGVAWDHFALGGGLGEGYRVVGGWDFAENDADPYDDPLAGSHGTHVTGIIGADAGANSGVAPGADLVALRVFDDYGQGSFDWVEQALAWVHENRNTFENPITTVNLSLGTNWNADSVPNWATLEDEFARLEDAGIFIAVAAGNSFTSYNEPGLSYPAASSHVVPVLSVDADGSLSDFSQRHTRGIAAPGRRITSTVPDYVGNFNGVTDDFDAYSGTSMAAPYLAGASVLVREALQNAGHEQIDQAAIYDVLRSTADTIYDPETDANYLSLNLEAAIRSVIPSEQPGSSAETAIDWGTVDSNTIDALQLSGQETWFQIQASHSATLTVEAWLQNSTGNVSLSLYDAGTMTLLADSATASSAERLDVLANAGDHFYLRLSGDNGQVDLQLTNLVRAEGGRVDVFGSDMADHFTMVAGQTHVLTVNGASYEFSSSTSSVFHFHGGSGDVIEVTGTTAHEQANVQSDQFHFGGADYYVSGTDFASVELHGGGGYDRARLVGSDGDDVLTGDANQIGLTGAGYSNRLRGFARVQAAAGAGHDVAELSGTDEADLVIAGPSRTAIYAGMFHYDVYGFDSVVTRGLDGNDLAAFQGAAENTTFTTTGDTARVVDSTFDHQATGFETIAVAAQATAGARATEPLTSFAAQQNANQQRVWHAASSAPGVASRTGALDHTSHSAQLFGKGFLASVRELGSSTTIATGKTAALAEEGDYYFSARGLVAESLDVEVGPEALADRAAIDLLFADAGDAELPRL